MPCFDLIFKKGCTLHSQVPIPLEKPANSTKEGIF